MSDDIVSHLALLLKPDPARVVIRPFAPAVDAAEFATADCSRAQRIADWVLSLGSAEAADELSGIVASLSEHRWALHSARSAPGVH